MEITPLKSSVTRFYDYRDFDLSELIPRFCADEEALCHDIELLRKKNAVPTEAAVIEADDFVTLSCTSGNKRFNKASVTVKVGRGLFSKELEAQLIGLEAGEEKELPVGLDSVFVKILKIVRNVLPELSDDVVKSWGMDGISGVDGLKSYLIAAQREAYINDMAESMVSEVQSAVNARCEFSTDENEIKENAAESHALLRAMMNSSGIDFDSAADDELKELTGMTREEHIAYIEGVFLDNFKSTLVSRELIKRDGIVFTEEDFRKALAEQAAFMEVSEDEAAKDFTPDIFLKQKISDRYYEQVGQYIRDYLEEE